MDILPHKEILNKKTSMDNCSIMQRKMATHTLMHGKSAYSPSVKLYLRAVTAYEMETMVSTSYI